MGKILNILILFSSLTCAQLIGPKLSVQQSEYDFGEVKQGELVEHEYIVSNTGDDLLVINDVRASCGCTAAKPEKDSLNPGESTKIKVQFNTTGREGLQQKSVYLSTNDREKSEFRLKFTATVIIAQSKIEDNSNNTTSHN